MPKYIQITTIHMSLSKGIIYLLDNIWKYIEVKIFRYLLEIDILKKSAQKKLGILMCVFEGFALHTRHRHPTSYVALRRPGL